VEFAELLELFVLPTGGGQFILTGKSPTYGDSYSASLYVEGTEVLFTAFSGLLPGMLSGTLTIGNGFGAVIVVDTNQIQELTLKSFAPPCVLK
jgi:hypothetical protein